MLTLGAPLGADEGALETVGFADGEELGNDEGSFDRDGTLVGEVEGDSLGAADGPDDGSELG